MQSHNEWIATMMRDTQTATIVINDKGEFVKLNKYGIVLGVISEPSKVSN